jgi:hypothetical protein
MIKIKSEYKWSIAILSVIGLGVLIFKKIKKSMEYGTRKVWDSSSEKIINTLHPKVRDKAREFLNRAEDAGIKIRVTSGYRTYKEQDALYAKGRTTSGAIVTKAKAGQSSHNFGTAMDVVRIENGKAVWNSGWEEIGKIGKSVGFDWGGEWVSFVDKPHFQMNFGNTISQLRAKYDKGQITDGYVNLP